MRKTIFALVLFFVTGSPAMGTVYQWEDQNGNVFLTDDFQKIPEPYRAHAQKIPSSSRKSVPPLLKGNEPLRFEQMTDKRGNDKKWWQDLKKRWERKKKNADDKIKVLELEIRQLEGHTMMSNEARAKEKRRMQKQLKAAKTQRDVASRMLMEGLFNEAKEAGAPRKWLTEKP